jgi:HAD superfamily hydrolase (TIGR01509 family)
MLLPVHADTKLLIFDCDGTIANNMHIHLDVWTDVLKQKNLSLENIDIQKYNGLPANEILESVFNLSPDDASNIQHEIKSTTNSMIHQSTAIQPVVDVIKHYYGKKKMLVISGGHRNNVLLTLKGLGITEYFEEIITADDNHPPKSKVEAFTLLADKYNLHPSECHVFEDGVKCLINALTAGMTVTDARNIDL